MSRKRDSYDFGRDYELLRKAGEALAELRSSDCSTFPSKAEVKAYPCRRRRLAKYRDRRRVEAIILSSLLFETDSRE